MPETLLPYQIGISAIVVWILQLAKNSPWFPWITANTDKLNRGLAILLAFLTSVGFHFTMQGSWTTGGQIIIAFPSLLAIVQILLHTAGQGVIQEGIYNLTVKPTPAVLSPAAVTTLNQVAAEVPATLMPPVTTTVHNPDVIPQPVPTPPVSTPEKGGW